MKFLCEPSIPFWIKALLNEEEKELLIFTESLTLATVALSAFFHNILYKKVGIQIIV